MSKVMQKSNIQSDKKDTLPAMVSWYVPEKILRNGKWQVEIEVMARKASQWLSWKKALKLRENQTEIEKVKIKTLVNKWDKLQKLKKSI